MENLFNRLLEYYQISKEDYLKINAPHTLSNFDDGHHFEHIEEACELVSDFIAQDKIIAIYGDYDADGIMGTSILVKMFNYLHYQPLYYIPNRIQDGYAITLKKSEEWVAKGVNLVITVDNGVTAFEAISYLKSHGVKVIVLDHHLNDSTLPEADYIIHPILSHFGEIATSGAFTAFMFASTLLKRRDKYLSTLAAISLISDMMPLKEYNRYFLKTVIENYQSGEFLPIDLLSNKKGFTWDSIGMIIAPRINSVGRLKEDESINEIIPYFACDDPEYILNYYSKIEEMNSKRKTLSSSLAENLEIDPSNKAIVVLGDYQEGLIGLIATSLVCKYHKPVIVFTRSDEETYKGSARSIEGFNLIDAFSHFEQYFLTRGGHANAAGCSIKKENYEAFKKEFINYVNQTNIEYQAPKAIEISINDINKDNVQLINSFAPFGQEWPQPILSLNHLKVSELNYSKNQLHIMKYIGLNKKIVGFGFSKVAMEKFNYINTYGVLSTSTYNGHESIDYLIAKIFEA